MSGGFSALSEKLVCGYMVLGDLSHGFLDYRWSKYLIYVTLINIETSHWSTPLLHQACQHPFYAILDSKDQFFRVA
jgi:hypothetical protein